MMVRLINDTLMNKLVINILEFADFTSAQERIALGKKSKKVEASKRRDEMKELIEDAFVSSVQSNHKLADSHS